MSRPDSGIDRHETSQDGANTASSGTIDFLFWLSQLACDPAAKRSANETLFSGPRPFGHFQLESLLGTGTYGAVFRAVDLELDRAVAVKVAWPAVLLDPEASRRFVEEPKTVAALEHPGIVRVYDSGNIEMARYIALELIEGPTLAEWAKAQDQVPVAVALQVVQRVAEALGYAHRHGIVHRDLKPSNILLRSIPSGSDSLTFVPVVTDFGLARRQTISDATNATATHAILGTDRYMSPEQASGLAKEVGSESDVFSLGVILYELLAGRRPFDGESGEAIRAQIQRDDPPKLRPWRKSVHRDIETIVFKCLEKSARHRYANAGELADDLRRFQSHEPIRARPASALTKAWKFARRRPLLVASTAAGIVGAIVVSALMGAVIEDRRSAARELAAAKAAAVAAEGMERQHQYATMILSAAKAQSRGNRADAIRYLRECSDLATPPVRRGIEWNLLSATVNHVDQVLRANFGGVRTVRFSPSGDLMICGGSDSRLIFWDTATWKPRRSVFNSGRAIKSAEFSADGSLLAVGGENGRLVVHRLADEAIIYDEKLIDGRVFDIAWLGDAHQFAAGGEDGVLWVVDPSKKEARKSGPLEPSREAREVDPDHPNEIVSLAYLAERDLIAVLKAPCEVVLIDPKTLSVEQSWHREITFRSVGAMCRARRKEDYLVLAAARELIVIDSVQGTIKANFSFTQIVEELQFCDASGTLVACCRDGSAHAWSIVDILAGRADQSHSVMGHGSRALTVGISADGHWIATGGRDGTVRLWNRDPSGYASEIELPHQALVAEFSACGRWMALGCRTADGQALLEVFDVNTGRKLWKSDLSVVSDRVPDEGAHPWFPFAFHPRISEMALSRGPGGFETRDCETGEVLKSYSTNADAWRAIQYTADGNSFLVGRPPRAAIIDPLISGVEQPYPDFRRLVSLASSAGELWLTGSSPSDFALRRSLKGPVLRRLGPTSGMIETVALSADGRWLAAGGLPLEVYLWDLQGSKPAYRLVGHDGTIQSVRFTPDGNTLLSLGSDGLLKLWHVPTRSELLTIGSGADQVQCFGLHPSGQLLVLGTKQGKSYRLRTYRLDDVGGSFARTFDVAGTSTP